MSPSRRDFIQKSGLVATFATGGTPAVVRSESDESRPQRPRDAFQVRLEELGVEDQWQTIAKAARLRREDGMGHEEAFERAVRAHSRDGVDVETVRGEFINEQWRLVSNDTKIYVSLPPELQAVVERRLRLLGYDPTEDTDEWVSAAHDVVEFCFERERE